MNIFQYICSPGDDGEAAAAPGPESALAEVQIVVLRHVEARSQLALDRLVVRSHPELLQQDQVVVAASQQVAVASRMGKKRASLIAWNVLNLRCLPPGDAEGAWEIL